LCRLPQELDACMTWLENRDTYYTYGSLPKLPDAPQLCYWIDDEELWIHIYGYYASSNETTGVDLMCPQNWILA
jgi:hypothetical protein